MKDTDIGIDYSLGTANRDPDTEIHYGIISAHSLDPYALDCFEPEYGDPTCPKCGERAVDFDCEKHDNYDEYFGGCSDYVCESCHLVFDTWDCFPEEALGSTYNEGDTVLWWDNYNDVHVYKSPHYTYAQYCSPCAPGAGHLDHPRSPNSGAPKTYCLGPEWFENDEAPYPIYNVETGELLPSDQISSLHYKKETHVKITTWFPFDEKDLDELRSALIGKAITNVKVNDWDEDPTLPGRSSKLVLELSDGLEMEFEGNCTGSILCHGTLIIKELTQDNSPLIKKESTRSEPKGERS